MKRRTLIQAMTTSLLAGSLRPAAAATRIVIYKSATCGCCAGWAEHLRTAGYAVEARNVNDLPAIKRRFRVPGAVESCHTARVNGYVIEGHVPVKLIDRLLAEGPAIDGIALPAMPAGAPGMPGDKQGIWTVYAFSGDRLSVFEKI